MPCYRPLTAYHNAAHGAVYFYEHKRHGDTRQISLPCGQCVGCRLQRAHEWATRCIHEAQLHSENCFISLTYAQEKLLSQSLIHRDYQLFMKRLRNALGRKRYANNIAISESLYFTADMGFHPIPRLKYYMAGEYGSLNRRPHFHACLFGINFSDMRYWMKTKERIYRSATLEKLWPHGYSSIGQVTYESAAYIARYIMAKQTGDTAGKFYEHIDFETGEITDLKPEYNKMSLRHPIGKEWYDKYKSDVYPHGTVYHYDAPTKAPRYYDKLYERTNPDQHDQLKATRQLEAANRAEDNTPERLRAKERVTQARVNQLIRSIE